MKELKRIVENIQSVFAESSYPQEFLNAYEQMECLASHSGRETFLVQRKDTGEAAVAKCYDLAVFPMQPDFSFLRDIDHPGLPRVYEQYRSERTLCVVREYIEGEPLSDYAREKQLSMEENLAIADQLCDILQALHSHRPPIIHRDIKPENVIIRPDGSAALIDFDISRSYKDHEGNDTVFFGTKGYAPPEQYGFGQTDSRTDIYAFGVLLRWLITGSIHENRNITVNADIQRVIDRCTSFSPEARYADIAEVRRALKAVRTRTPRWPMSAVLALLAVAALCLCAGFAAGRFTEWLKPVPKITFAEPLIERAARLQLGKETGALTEDDLAQVKSLYIFGGEAFSSVEQYVGQRVDDHAEGPIRTLDDLALLPNLESVFIGRQGYVDVSGLAWLARAESVELKHMRISGVQPLAHISRLKYAVLFDTGVSDVTALEACPWLETLDVGLNGITSLAGIGSHPNVRNLGMMWNSLDDFDGVAERLPNLKTLTLQHGSCRDLSGLADAPRLAVVYVLREQEAAVREALAGRPDVEIAVTEN